MKLTYWFAESWGDGPSIIDKTKKGAQQQLDCAESARYSPATKRTITFADSFDLLKQATEPEGGRGIGEKS